MAFSFLGLDIGSKRSRSSSTEQQTSQDSVFLADLFSRLYGGASGAAAGINTAGITDAANQLFTEGGGFIDTLRSAAEGTDASGQYLTDRLTGGGTVDRQVADLKTQLDAFFNETLLPGITSDAASVGQLGGERQGVAQGIAAGKVAQAFSSGVTGIMTSEQQQRDAAAAQLASQTQGAAGAGLSFLPQQFGLAQSGNMAALSPYLALAQVLGGPTVLNYSQGTASSNSRSKEFSFGI